MRTQIVLFSLLVLTTIGLSLVSVVLFIQRKPLGAILTSPQSLFSGRYAITRKDSYRVQNQPVRFTFRTDLSFPVAKFRYSSAFQSFLNGSEIDMDILRPMLHDRTPVQIPNNISVLVTDTFVETDRTTYNEERKPLYAYAFSFDQQRDTLSVTVYISKDGWVSIYKSPTDESRIPAELLIGREVLFAFGQFDRRFYEQYKKFGDVVSKYLSADRDEQLL